jgi:DNA-binding NtrC family response regulator
MKKKKSILVVDDEISVRESLRMILTPIYEVHMASSGEEALSYIQKGNVDLVTLDLKMPGLSGIEVLREIKKIKSDIEVIIISAYGTINNADEAVRYGAGDFIVKPFEVADLIAIVSRSLERRNQGKKVKNLIQQINDLLSKGGGKKDELLSQARNLCEMLMKGDSSISCGEEEVLNFASMIARFSSQGAVDHSSSGGRPGQP